MVSCITVRSLCGALQAGRRRRRLRANPTDNLAGSGADDQSVPSMRRTGFRRSRYAPRAGVPDRITTAFAFTVAVAVTAGLTMAFALPCSHHLEPRST